MEKEEEAVYHSFIPNVYCGLASTQRVQTSEGLERFGFVSVCDPRIYGTIAFLSHKCPPPLALGIINPRGVNVS